MTLTVEKSLRIVLALVVTFGIFAVPAMAQTHEQMVELEEAKNNTCKPLVAIGAGIVTLGGAFGIGTLARAAMEGTARQPEAGGAIRTSMIIAAALIEGFTFFALIVCFLSVS